MDWKTTATLFVAVLLAGTGYLAKYLNDLRIAQRKDQLERVNAQLRELYGPLYALARASGNTWLNFRKLNRPDVVSYWESSPQPSEKEAAAWRRWMAEVFAPLNAEMARLVVSHADLLDDRQMPQCLLDLCAHVHAYKVVLEGWKVGDFSRNTSVIDFPADELLSYTGTVYSNLKQYQLNLLGNPRSLRSGV
jgi:hypothetical protein